MTLSNQMLFRTFRCSVCKNTGELRLENPFQKACSELTKPSQTTKRSDGIKRKPNENQLKDGECSSCGKNIHPGRLKANPGTRLCIDCAENSVSGSKNRTVKDTWGSRADWARDKGSWRR